MIVCGWGGIRSELYSNHGPLRIVNVRIMATYHCDSKTPDVRSLIVLCTCLYGIYSLRLSVVCVCVCVCV